MAITSAQLTKNKNELTISDDDDSEDDCANNYSMICRLA